MTPRLRAALVALPLLALLATPAHALRVTTWNLLDYNLSNANSRNPTFRTVLGELQTDVLVVQELKDAAAAESLLRNVLRVVQPGRVWKNGGFLLSTESAIYYDSLQVGVSNVTAVATGGPRQVLAALVRPNGYRTTPASFRVYSVHFKAGNPSTSPADSTTRRAECTALRNNLNLAPAGTNMLLGGDTNFYGSWEGGYARLTESQADNDGRMQDPFPLAGTWNANATIAPHHSQATCQSNCPAGSSGGGMDDRFDFWLGSTPLFDGAGLDVVPGYGSGATFVFGNDGLHFNNDIDGGGFNGVVPLPVATALRLSSDHLPVVVTLQLPPRVSAVSALAIGDAIVGGTASANLSVGNGAPVPADELDYTLAAPAGFTAPGGAFSVNAGAAALVHAVGMNTAAPGVLAGTLTIASDDPDTASKSVQLSGRVLAHAVGSLDSLAAVTASVLDLGSRPAGEFADSTVRVHNLGWNALQARLQVSAGSITGGAGRFTFVPGFAPALLSGAGQGWSVHFDPAGATLDSTYEATLQFTVQDEALPGQGAPGALTVTLRARVLPAVAAPASPAVLRLFPARPNPTRGAVELAFDLPREAVVSLEILDLAGRRVASLVEGRVGAGHQQVRWMPQRAGSAGPGAGLYFVRFRASGIEQRQRIVLLP